MASTAPSYPNSRASDTGKFSHIEMIRASTLAERHRNLLVAMLHKNRFGDELWMSTESICVVMGRVCYRRKTSGWSTHEKPRQLHDCEQISRRAVQRLIDEVCDLGVLTLVYGANEDVPYGGGKKFRHTATYRLNPDRLVQRKTHDEYVEERDRARARNRQTHREESQREHAAAEPTPIRKPAQPAPQPAAEHEHRGTERTIRTEGRHTYRQTKAFKDRIDWHEAGCSGSMQTRDGGRIFVSADSNPELYRAPLNRALALKRACEEFGWTVDSAIEAMKFHGFSLKPDANESPPS